MTLSGAKRIRVLVVDDSAVVRRLISQTLSLQPDLEVMGWAESGVGALEIVAADRPDAVVLDLEMPGMDGFETLRELKKRYSALPVLVFSTHTSQGANATVDALLAGADEYAAKPSNLASGSSAWQMELTSKLRAVTRRAFRQQLLRTDAPVEPRAVSARTRVSLRAIAIGCSSGGPEALGALLPRLSPRLGVPLFIVQHMPKSFTAALAGRLNDRCSLRVVEATHRQAVEPGVAYIAPGDHHLLVSNRLCNIALLLDDGALENGCRPSVDPLFRSASEVYGSGLLTIVLTGMGSDGVEGARCVAAAGGHTWIQDRESASIWGMPGAVSRAGLARRTCSLESMAGCIEAAVAQGLPSSYASQEGER